MQPRPLVHNAPPRGSGGRRPLLTSRPLRTVRAGFPAYSSSLVKRLSQDAVPPATARAVTAGGVRCNPSPPRGKRPAPVRRWCAVASRSAVGRVRDPPRRKNAPRGGRVVQTRAAAACRKRPSRYAPGAGKPCRHGWGPHQQALPLVTFLRRLLKPVGPVLW